MDAKKITAAMVAEDGDAVTELIKALRTADDDGILNLLEDIRVAIRKDTVADVLVDLEDVGETEAYEFIKVNY